MINYVVCFIFDPLMENVLLINKTGGPYPGKLNGVGGRVELNEDPFAACAREAQEETGIDLWNNSLMHVFATVNYPSGFVLSVFYAVLTREPDLLRVFKSPEGDISWFKTCFLTSVTLNCLAGEGNAAYFIHAARLAEGKT